MTPNRGGPFLRLYTKEMNHWIGVDQADTAEEWIGDCLLAAGLGAVLACSMLVPVGAKASELLEVGSRTEGIDACWWCEEHELIFRRSSTVRQAT